VRVGLVNKMDIIKFVSKLLPSFGRDRILEDIRITRGELLELQEVFSESAKMLARTTFKNKELNKKFDLFQSTVKSGSDNPITFIHKNIKNILDNLDTCEKLVIDYIGTTVASGGLNFKQANIIQFVDNIHYVNNFSRKFLHYVLVIESSQYEKDPEEAMLALSKPDREAIDKDFLNFCSAFKTAILKKEDLLKKFADIPEAQVTESSNKTLTQTVGIGKIDPFSLGFAGNWLNPIYFIRMSIAEWQVKRYQATKDQTQALRLRLMQLEQQRNGKENPKLEKEIAYYEKLVQQNQYEIDKVEKQYG